jgi:signal transduction histidine kinase
VKIQIKNDFNLKKQAEELGVKVWQTPGGLFANMGVITIFLMFATYVISKNYNRPEVLVIAECSVAILTLIINASVSRFVEQISRLNRMKTEFISVASHQLRTPLSAIKWETELLLSKFRHGLNEKQLKNIENISLLSKKMTKLVNDLLDVARIDQNRLVLRKQSFDLAVVVKNSLNEAFALIKARHIVANLNASEEAAMAYGDAEKIKLAVDNLLDNSLRYTVSGGHVQIKIFKEGKDIIFEIKDDGAGIPEEQFGRVFEKFFRSDNAVKYQTEGSGLGLYIAKNIIEQSGGHIWFHSTENVGSVFSFSLPAE